jgi:hypothetical protein
MENVMVSRSSVEKAVINWIQECDNETLTRIYNENFDESVKYIGDGYFEVSEQEAERTGMFQIIKL